MKPAEFAQTLVDKLEQGTPVQLVRDLAHSWNQCRLSVTDLIKGIIDPTTPVGFPYVMNGDKREYYCVSWAQGSGCVCITEMSAWQYSESLSAWRYSLALEDR